MTNNKAKQIADKIKRTHYSKESDFQKDVISYLKARGFYVIKHQAGFGVPTGTPDISFYIDGFYGFLELKLRKNSPHQPGQDAAIKKLNGWSYARFLWPEAFSQLEEDLWDI